MFEDPHSAASAGAAAPGAHVPLSPEEKTAKDRETGLLQHELETTKAFLQSVIEQKEAANEELRAANEEVVSINEELQITNEELQKAEEELQATNEELTTVNDELRSRIAPGRLPRRNSS